MRARTLSSLALLAACAPRPQPASLPQLAHRATYDLRCPFPQLGLVHVSPRTKVVTGCGRSTVYVQSCTEDAGGRFCDWRVDAPLALEPVATPAPPRLASTAHMGGEPCPAPAGPFASVPLAPARRPVPSVTPTPAIDELVFGLPPAPAAPGRADEPVPTPEAPRPSRVDFGF